MEDGAIIELYWARNEAAIRETDLKYGRFCHSLALNILSQWEDAEECVSDTYRKAWESIPPERPQAFRAWLGRVVRNLSINRWHYHRARKRYQAMDDLLSELSDCIPVLACSVSNVFINVPKRPYTIRGERYRRYYCDREEF